MRSPLLLLIAVVLLLNVGAWPSAQQNSAVSAKVADVEKVAAGGPFAPRWDSLARFQVRDWYQDAKFGIFIHWGLYSVPAFGNEWFDWWIAQPAVHPHLQKFAAFYYKRGVAWKTGVAINYKKHGGESFPDTGGVLDVECGQLAGMRPLFWQTDTSVSKNSWGYITNHDYKTADSLIDDLVDIVSKNGALLLNIGQKPDGTIAEPEERILREIGQWLSVNGEAIYGTRPWTTFGEGRTAVVEGPFSELQNVALIA